MLPQCAQAVPPTRGAGAARPVCQSMKLVCVSAFLAVSGRTKPSWSGDRSTFNFCPLISIKES